MYTLIIIDDEIHTLKLLSKMVDWESLGFSLSETFHSSQKAFDYIKANRIDVIITDIKMPKISGIDIAKYCHDNGLGTKIVFLSGFQLFDYAQQGIKYKVSDFLTKPITKKDLTETLVKIRASLQSAKRDNMFENYLFHNEIHKNIIDIFTGEIKDIKAFGDKLAENSMPVNFDTAYFACVTVTIEKPDDFYQQIWIHGRERLVSALEQLINMTYGEAYVTLADFDDVCFDIYMISKPETTHAGFERFVSDFTSRLQIMLKECIHMDTSIQAPVITNNIEEIKSSLKAADKKTVPDKELSVNSNLHTAKDYIDKHFAEHISLSDISKMIGFSPRYFSVLFKNKFDISFSDYLTQIRIDAAKVLLEDNETKISSIPALIGLSDFSNFSKRFKEYTGMSPSEYKNKCKNQ